MAPGNLTSKFVCYEAYVRLSAGFKYLALKIILFVHQ